MQSGYGVPELQQFMVDGCASLLSMSCDLSSPAQQQKQQQQQQLRQSGKFHQHLHPAVPTTQHFFFQQPTQFPVFHHQQQQHRRLHQKLGLEDEQEPGPESSTEGLVMAPPPAPHFVNSNFSLRVNGSRCAGEGLNGGGAVHGSVGGSDGQLVRRWHHQQREEEQAAIKEPSWRPLDLEFINRNNKRCKEKEEAASYKYPKEGEDVNENEERRTSGSNYGLFSELEAIYTHSSDCCGGNNQAGSGSALTGDNNEPNNTGVTGVAGGSHSGIDHGSETLTGEEASLKKHQKSRKKKKRKQLSSIAAFFHNLIKQLMEHQENLHKKFMEVMEKRDQERISREEAWRRQELAKYDREAMARAQEQALASSREAAIVSFLEKFTGESISFPGKTQLMEAQKGLEETKLGGEKANNEALMESFNSDSNTNSHLNNGGNVDYLNSRRWPKSEVQALIRVRSGLETRFQEPGLKAPLWEEVSSSMAAMGYQRSAKRCKEKWENINKYFRKTKDNVKRRSQNSKTCPYFHQLDELYSKSSRNHSDQVSVVPSKDDSQLLDAMVVPSEHCTLQNPSFEFVEGQQFSYKYPELGSGNDNYSEAIEINAREVLLQLQQEHDNEVDDLDQEDDDEDDEDEDEDEEEEDNHD